MRAKYATYGKYEKYINMAMDSLGLTGKVNLEWRFRHWKRKGGSAILYTRVDYQGRRVGLVDISNRNSHAFILTTILHELKHIQQMLTGRLELGFVIETGIKQRGKNKGQKEYSPAAKWDGVLMQFHRLNRKAEREAYYDDPWEKDAYAYGTDATAKKVFTPSKFIGTAGKNKFYKIG